MLTLPGYNASEEIYRSANSIVYRAVRERDNQPVLIKIHNSEYPSPNDLAKYRREYEIASQTLQVINRLEPFGQPA